MTCGPEASGAIPEKIMKKTFKSITLSVAILLITALLSGCVTMEPQDNKEHVGAITGLKEGSVIDLASEMVPISSSPTIFVASMPAASGTSVKINAKAEIDYSNPTDGYVMVRFLEKTARQLRVLVTGPTELYKYTLKQNGDWEVYPLSDGNGDYTIAVWEQVEGDKYALTNSVEFSVTLKDEFAPFLRPNQYVNFTNDCKVAKKAAELVGGVSGMQAQVAAVYEFVINNFTYDREKAENVKTGYLPDVDAILEAGKGICFDYAALMTAMLRSRGIPTKLVVGYAGTQYHAWISVYSPETGWINSIIRFDGMTWNLMDPTFASSANQSAEVMEYIGDGANYQTKYLY